MRECLRWLCFGLCVHVYTIETHVGAGKIRLLGMKSHGKSLTRWWQRASFPPYDENHVSGSTRAEEGMVSENTSGAASSQQLDEHLSCTWSPAPPLIFLYLDYLSQLHHLSPFFLPFFLSTLFSCTPQLCAASSGGPLCMCVPIVCGAKSRSGALFSRRGEHVTTGLNTSVVLDTP